MADKRRYFGTDGIRGTAGKHPITPLFMVQLGWAVGKVLSRKAASRVLIGKDTRISGYMLESALEAGLSAAGMDVILLGPMPTPAVAFLTTSLRAQAGIVISASHNPYHDNGIKFFTADGSKFSDDWERQIEALMDEPFQTVEARELGKAFRLNDAAGRYIEFCKRSFPRHLDFTGLKIVLDCANGATYQIAPKIFSELGATVIAINISPDGFNINDISGSTHPASLKSQVLLEGADLGIAFDGDGDRVIMVDHQGEILDGDELLYIIARDRFELGTLGGGVVGTVMSNFGLEKAFKQLTIPFVRSAVGDRSVARELSNLGWQLGGEASGHLISLDIASTGDGIISALQVLAAMLRKGQNLRTIKSGMEKLPQQLINVPIVERLDPDTHPAIQLAVKKARDRLSDTGRILLRCSGTELLLRVMVEGTDRELVNGLAADIADAVRNSVIAGA